MEERLEVALLGPVQVVAGGRPARLPGSSPRVVLARLALAAGRVVTTDALTETLWQGDPPANAVGNLHSYVSRLRRVVGADTVVREPGGYRMRLAAEQVDVGRAERLVGDAREPGLSDAVRAQLLGTALGLWRGEPLMGLPDPMPFAADLARLRAWRLQLLEEWLELRLRTGDAAEALPDLEAATTDNPERERLQLLLMRALHAAGRTPEALAVAADFRRRQAEQSGLDPSRTFYRLERQLLTDDPSLVPSRPSPPAVRRRAPADRFVGREEELAELQRLVRQHRLVTVVGTGGIGKTRLVLELLDRLRGEEHVYVAELAQVSAAVDMPAAVAGCMGLRAAPDGVEVAIADRLRQQDALLVLDNCEHVVSAARRLADDLLSRHPRLRVLSTSRRRLGAAGEQVFRLDPLSEAVQAQLFYDRASSGRRDVADTDRTRRLTTEICRLVGGIPLGVELAARREAVFGLDLLRDRLSSGLAVIDHGPDADRSTAMTATIDWSYRLQDAQAQTLFRRLAVCRGGFGLDAVTRLAPAGRSVPEALLAELVEASLVVADVDARPPRYRLLEPMCRFVQDRLSRAEWHRERRVHARWMLDYATRMYQLRLEGSPEAAAAARREAANLREALAFFAEERDWHRAGRMGVCVALWVAFDPHLELLAQLRRLEPAGGDLDEAGALCALAAGTAALTQGESAHAHVLVSRGLAALPSDHPCRWVGLFFRLASAMFTGDAAVVGADALTLRDDPHAPIWAKAIGVCSAALFELFAGHRDAADGWLSREASLLDAAEDEGFVSYTRGELAAAVAPDAALAWFELSGRQCEASGNIYIREVAAIGRAAVLIRGGHADAPRACRALIDDLRSIGMSTQLATVLRLTAELLARRGDPGTAAVLLAATDTDVLAPVVMGPDLERRDALWAQVSRSLGPGAATAAAEEAAGHGFPGAVQRAAEALDRLLTRPGAPPPGSPVTSTRTSG